MELFRAVINLGEFQQNPKEKHKESTMDSGIAQKYHQIKDLSTEHATKCNQVFLVENKHKEVCVLKYVHKTLGWYKQPDMQNKLMNVRHNW